MADRKVNSVLKLLNGCLAAHKHHLLFGCRIYEWADKLPQAPEHSWGFIHPQLCKPEKLQTLLQKAGMLCHLLGRTSAALQTQVCTTCLLLLLPVDAQAAVLEIMFACVCSNMCSVCKVAPFGIVILQQIKHCLQHRAVHRIESKPCSNHMKDHMTLSWSD